jgi:RimJ/RimL family protein N-acetyltransferase
VITEGRVRLRALEEGDLERTRAWVNDPEVARLVNRVTPVTGPQHREWYQRVLADPHQVIFAIEVVPDGMHIGNCGLKHIDPRVRKGELWVYLGERAYWGQGYGTEACQALCRYGFERLNLHRIYLYVAEYNRSAIRLYERLGFHTEGRLRDDIFQDGRHYDSVIMGLLRSEFMPRAQRGRGRRGKGTGR